MSDDLLETMKTPNSEWHAVAKSNPARVGAHVQPIRETIGVGSVVRLKSGGPHMTVIERGPNWCYLTWFKEDESDPVLKDWIPISCLEVVK